MIVKRKLDGTVDKSSADQEIVHNLSITCEKSGGLHLVIPDLMAGKQAALQMKLRRGLKF